MSDRPRAIFGHQPLEIKTLLPSYNENPPIPNSSLSFPDYARRITEVGDSVPFTPESLKKLSDLLGLTPVAYQVIDHHWSLVIQATRTPQAFQLETYDPASGIHTANAVRGNIYYFFDRSLFHRSTISSLIDSSYSLPKSPLIRLGRIQSNDPDDLNSGALSVFAAKAARDSL